MIWNLLLYLCYPLATVVDSLQNTPTRLSSTADIVSESLCRESDVPIDESFVAPGSMNTSSRDLTRSQGEMVRSSLENADPATLRRRVAGKGPSFFLYLQLYPMTWTRQVCLIASQRLECRWL